MSKKAAHSALPETQPQVHAAPNREAIAIRAYELWVSRGSPLGSPEVDWERAEQELLQGVPSHVDGQSRFHLA